MMDLIELRPRHASRRTRRLETVPAKRPSPIDMPVPHGSEFLPTPSEIQAECRRIQSEWTDKERRRRAGIDGATRYVDVRRGRVTLDAGRRGIGTLHG
jgi:hypothetical protein